MSATSRLKGALVALHLYLGLALCLFFAAWFLSGIAMMYYTTPILQPRERHSVSAPLPWHRIKVEPADAALQAGWKLEPLKEARLGSLLERPVLRALPREGSWQAVFLDTGERVDLNAGQALGVAQAAMGGSWRVDGIEVRKDWTQHGALDPHEKAFRLVSTDGRDGSILVSASTGDVILHKRKGFEWLYVAGPILHYYTLKVLRDHPPLWNNLVDWSSGLGAFMCLTGLILGVWFLRWGRLATDPKKAVPYQKAWMWWHHALGMLFGIVTFTWVLSGLFSMNPMKIFPSSAADKAQAEAFRGAPFTVSSLQGIAELAKLQPEGCEAALSAFEGQLTAKVWPRELKAGKVFRRASSGKWEPATLLSPENIGSATARAFPRSSVARLEWLETQDAYYYDRPEKRRWRSFPVYRAVLVGTEAITLYLDPFTGEIFLRHVPGSKLRRWLYNGMHSFDFGPIYTRPFWDALLILMCLAGLSLSVTGVVLSWRWLRKWANPNQGRTA